MDKEQERKKLINVLYRTGRMAMRSQWTGGGDESARFCVEQYNRILARLKELDPEIGSIFVPLEPTASLNVVAIACRQLVSYYEDEARQRGWHFERDFVFERGCRPGRGAGRGAAGFYVPVASDIEEFGNMIRDWVQGWRTGWDPSCHKSEEHQKQEGAPKTEENPSGNA
ncbi:MAG TPA: hypothetical protein VFC63_16430 [Blastocatellia bacterium]|nr:hypothetical protein [Blastocatellia bacterium]